MNPARCDRSCFRGATYTHTLTFTDGAPINLSDRTWTATAWPVGSPQSPVCTFTVDDTDAATGVLVLSLTAAQTSVLSGKFRWALVGTGTEVEAPVGGVFLVSDDAVTIGSTSDATTVTYTPESTTVQLVTTGTGSSVVDAAWWTVPTGPDQLLSLRRGQATVIGDAPAYDIEGSCWGTYVDVGDRHGATIFRPLTQDAAPYLVQAPDAVDIAALGGIDVQVSARASHPCWTDSTIYYLAQQSIDDPPIFDWAVSVDRDGRLCFDWVDGSATFRRVKFGSDGRLTPPSDRHDVRVAIIDNEDGSATAWGWVKYDHDGPWLPLDPFVGPGSDFESWTEADGFSRPGVTLSAPDFVTRTDPACTGFGRGFTFGSLVIREPSTDPIDTPGAVAYQLDMADAAESVTGDTFTSNGDTWTMAADGFIVGIDPAESGWLFHEVPPDYSTTATIPHADVPVSFAGNFTIGVRFTPTKTGSAAQYVRTVDLGAPPQPAGLIIGDLTAYALDHVVVLADGTTTITDDGIVLTSWVPHDLIAVVNRDADTLTVYVDGVARDSVDISTLGAITNSNDLVFSGGGEAPTMTHCAVLVDRACTAADVAAIRRQWAAS